MSHDRPNPLRRLALDLSDLLDAFETRVTEAHYYFDLETGRVLLVTDEVRGMIQKLSDGLGADTPEAERTLTERAQESNMPDWQVPLVLEAFRVERGLGARYIEIPTEDSHQAYEDMEDFAVSVENIKVRRHLQDTLQERKPFRRFQDALSDYPRERREWFEFKDRRMRDRAIEWLKFQGIELVDPSPQKGESQPTV